MRTIPLALALPSYVASFMLLLFTPYSKSIAAPSRFFCGTSQGKPATLVRTRRGDRPIVIWERSLGGNTAQQRCQIASNRFQNAYDAGRLNYLTVGEDNNQAVVCTAEVKDGDCNYTLFTLKPGADPNAALRKLLEIRAYAENSVIYEGAGGRVYVDFQAYLRLID